jgi:hypothetical protein
MDKLNEILGKVFGVVIVRDLRVKRFTEETAVKFLRDHNCLGYLWDDDIWAEVKSRPEEDLVQAYTDVCYERECCPE